MYRLDEIELFLIKIDKTFPIALSEKVNLKIYASKLFNEATIFIERNNNNEIIGMVAGYTKNVIDKRAYVAIVSVDSNFQNQGIAAKLVCNFLDKCRSLDLESVHLYTHKTNMGAIKLYKKLGFIEYEIVDELRKDDLHFIYDFGIGELMRNG